MYEYGDDLLGFLPDDNDDLVNLRNLNGIRDRDKKTQFWTTFKELPSFYVTF